MARGPKNEASWDGQARALRADRDRYAALAFCASDMLLELTPNLTVAFAAGATMALTGRAPEDLQGLSFIDLVAPRDRPLVREIMKHAAAGHRLESVIIHLDGPDGDTPPLTLLGCHLPDMGGHYYLALRVGPGGLLFGMEEEPAARRESGLTGALRFAETTGECLLAGREAGKEYALTLLRLENLLELRARLDDRAKHELMSTVSRCFRAEAVDDHMAGQFADESYGLVHAKGKNVDGLCAHLQEFSRKLDPENAGLTVRSATLEMDVADMSESDSVKALAYTINRFCTEDAEGFAVDNLSAALTAMMGDTVHRMTEFKTVVTKSNFELAFQPVVDLATRSPHHYEVLARFSAFGDRITPYGAITFAEQTGMVCDFDLAMCAKVIDWLTETRRNGRDYMVAVNLSGSSIGSPAFVRALQGLLAKHDELRDKILFEITESAKIVDLEAVNRSVQSLRQAGHKVCLDDFGAGAAAFQYLRALDVDVVKIDGAYVRDALSTGKGRAFLKAMAGLCNDLGIATVAEMVEEEECIGFLRQCGVDFGQGYLFGRPNADITTFEATGGENDPNEALPPTAKKASGRR